MYGQSGKTAAYWSHNYNLTAHPMLKKGSNFYRVLNRIQGHGLAPAPSLLDLEASLVKVKPSSPDSHERRSDKWGTRVQPYGSSLKWPRLEVRRFYTARSSLSLLSDEARVGPNSDTRGRSLHSGSYYLACCCSFCLPRFFLFLLPSFVGRHHCSSQHVGATSAPCCFNS